MTANTHSVSPSIEFCDSESLSTFHWPASEVLGRDFLEELLTHPSERFVRNVKTECLLTRIGPHVLPTTINETDYQNSWVCSPYNACITYPLEELREIRSRSLRTALAALIHSVAPLLRMAKINQVVCLNNWLLSTNLYPRWSGDGVAELTAAVLRRWPQHAILFRSLNCVSNGELLRSLMSAGYLLLPSRQIYICEDLDAAAAKQNSEIDRDLLDRRTGYQVVRHAELSDQDDARIRELYEQLYLRKYTIHNPQFSDELLRLWRTTGFLKMMGLRSPAGVLDGIVGCFGCQGVMTTPLIGYNLTRPKKRGLYRMLTSLVFQEARQSRQILNLSAGAAQFKRHRGGEPHLEYSAVFVGHLSKRRRIVWKALSLLLEKVGVRVLQRYEL